MIFQLGISDEIPSMLQQLKETFSNVVKIFFEAGDQEFKESPQNAVLSKGLF